MDDYKAMLDELNPEIPELNKRIVYFLQSMAGEDYDGILLLTYPGIFDMVPKKILREKIASTFQSEDMAITMDVFDINYISKAIVAEDGRYVRVDYTLLMSLKIKEDLTLDEERRAEKKELFLKSFKVAYGKNQFWFEELTQSYCFHKKNSMIAIENEKSPQWTFLTYQPGAAMEMFIPKSVCLLLDAG